MSLLFRRAHCCIDVAIKAQVKLRAKLKNQRKLTQTADVRVVNKAAELVNDGGLTTWDPFLLESV